MGVHWVQCVRGRGACTCRCRFVCRRVCTAMSLGCVIEMEMSQSATAVVCLLTLHSLHSSSSPTFTLFFNSVCMCVSLSICVCGCVYWQCLALQFQPQGPEELVKMYSLGDKDDLNHSRTHGQLWYRYTIITNGLLSYIQLYSFITCCGAWRPLNGQNAMMLPLVGSNKRSL